MSMDFLIAFLTKDAKSFSGTGTTLSNILMVFFVETIFCGVLYCVNSLPIPAMDIFRLISLPLKLCP